MKQRCFNPKAPTYYRYGGRGISVCDWWQGWPEGFDHFVSDMGPKPSASHTLDRIDNNGDYEPSNCRWATPTEQAMNTRQNVILHHNGRTYTTADLANAYGLTMKIVALRINQGKTFEQIISRHHLEPGYDHMQDAIDTAAQLNHARTHCKNGHELTPENTGYCRGKEKHWRHCKRCYADATKRYRSKHLVPRFPA